MAINTTQKQAAKRFVERWMGKGYEKGETQRFWLDLLHNVFGVDDPTKVMQFEIPVKTITKEKGSDFIDGYIAMTKVLIEQKGSHIDLSAKAKRWRGIDSLSAGPTLCRRPAAVSKTPLDCGLQFQHV